MSSSSAELTSEQLDAALVAASSPDWKVRTEAVVALARATHDPKAFGELAERLDDSDSAVIEAAVDGLVRRGGKAGLREVLKALTISEDDVGYHIRDRLVAIYLDGFPVAAQLQDVLNDASEGAIRDGAFEIIRLLDAR